MKLEEFYSAEYSNREAIVYRGEGTFRVEFYRDGIYLGALETVNHNFAVGMTDDYVEGEVIANRSSFTAV